MFTKAPTPVPRKIIHVDMDAFYASVEQRDHPPLRGRPVIVGGRPGGRGVVAACSYEARAFGVHSAMPASIAARRCPDAVFLRPRFEVYRAISAEIQSIFHEVTDQVQPLSLDEAYLDVTASPREDGSAWRMARWLKTEIHRRTALVASAGVSYNKLLAKLASDHDKPDGLFAVLPGEGEAYVASLPVGRLHGIGPATVKRLAAHDINTGADLQALDLAELQRLFGRHARWFHDIARGIDERPVRTGRTRKSRGAERTFSSNLHTRNDMLDVLNGLCDKLLVELSERELQAHCLTLKLRHADFTTLSRQARAPGGAALNATLCRALVPLLLERALDGAPHPAVRLLGIAFSDFSPQSSTQQLSLF